MRSTRKSVAWLQTYSCFLRLFTFNYHRIHSHFSFCIIILSFPSSSLGTRLYQKLVFLFPQRNFVFLIQSKEIASGYRPRNDKLLLAGTLVRHNFTKLNVSSATALQAIHRRCGWVIAIPITCRAFMGILCSNRQNAFTHACSACQCLDGSCAAAVGAS